MMHAHGSSGHTRDHQRIAAVMVAMLAVATPTGAAAQLANAGIGGGGWLHSGAFHSEPGFSNIVVIGGDNSGIYRTTNFGQSWTLWNDNLASPDEALSFYVDDIVGVSASGQSPKFYAATRGGIYEATYSTTTGPSAWTLMTDPECGYNYKDTGRNVYDLIQFSCIDWNKRTSTSDRRVVAGAGRVRWATPGDETSYYPGIPGPQFAPGLVGTCNSVSVTSQWTVWVLNNSTGVWQPDQTTTFGPARDISAIKKGNTQYVGVATLTGVYLKKGTAAWQNLGVPAGVNSDAAWSIALTSRGTLYAAFAGNGTGGGVYRIANIASPGAWQFVGNGALLPPTNETIATIAQIENLVWLSVQDPGSSSQLPDVLYLGARGAAAGSGVNSRRGLYKAQLLPSDNPSAVTWAHVLYRTGTAGNFTWVPPSFNPGYDNVFAGPEVIFPPIVHSPYTGTATNRVVLQVNGRLHTSTDAGASWSLSHTQPVGASWLSRGYNQLAIPGLDFLSDGRLLLGTRDFGIVRSMDNALSAFEWVPVPTSANPTCGFAASFESPYGHPRANWLGSGAEYTFVSNGKLVAQAAKGRMFVIDPSGTYHEMTCSLDQPPWSPGDRDLFLFEDFAFDGDGVILVSYSKYDTQQPPQRAEVGVLRGQKVFSGPNPWDNPGDWTWTTFNNGLVDPETGFNRTPEKILFNAATNTFFMAARNNVSPVVGSVDGGLLYLGQDGGGAPLWIQVFPSNGAPGIRYEDFRSLAQSADGSVLYAGTNGRQVGNGVVIKCAASLATNPANWIEISDGLSFGFDIRFFNKSPWTTPEWTLDQTGRELADVRSLAVDPTNSNVVYAGLHSFGSLEEEGVWRYESGTTWTPMAASPLRGIGVYSLLFNPIDATELLIGTSGNDVFTLDVNGPGAAPKPLPVYRMAHAPELRIIDARPAAGGALIRLSLDAPSPITLDVYDVSGRRVKRLDTAPRTPGVSSVEWDGTNQSGRRVAAGTYFLRATAGERSVSTKFLLVR